MLSSTNPLIPLVALSFSLEYELVVAAHSYQFIRYTQLNWMELIFLYNTASTKKERCPVSVNTSKTLLPQCSKEETRANANELH